MRISDWSSDVCSSDLAVALDVAQVEPGRLQPLPLELHDPRLDDHTPDPEGGIAVAGGEHPADAGPAADPVAVEAAAARRRTRAGERDRPQDRKSTRLNSSH